MTSQDPEKPPADAIDDRLTFDKHRRESALRMKADTDLLGRAQEVAVTADQYDWSYQWTWLGVPCIQMPPDILATQEIIWQCRPQVIVETGVARGGSTILHSSILELLGEGRVVAVDIDIRAHNRESIETHPLGRRVTLLEGSSVDPIVLDRVRGEIESAERVMVVLDSDHTHEHVLAELRLYAPLVTPGQFLIVADTAIERIPPAPHRPRRWGPGNSPGSALREFMDGSTRFEEDPFLNAKLLMTASPGGYLRCVGPE